MPDYSKYAPEKQQAEELPRRKIFLVLAVLMIAGAITTYVYEDVLYDINYDSSLFVGLLVTTVSGALFFLYCFGNRRFGNRVLGRELEPDVKHTPRSGVGATYNVFKSESVGDVKISHARRKSARHMRRKLARNTPRPGAKAKAGNGAGNGSGAGGKDAS